MRGPITGAAIAALLCALFSPSAFAQGDARRGEYVAKAGGCLGCHTEAKQGAVPFAGGRALKTPFGTFYGPNITPHTATGIGRWTEADFVRAMREGRRPDGAHYFPAFPYPSFTRVVDADLRDLWAYLRSLPATERRNQQHDLGLLYRWRFLVGIWKWLYFTPGPFKPDVKMPPPAQRGAYLVEALGHCGECHTPRNWLGGPRSRQRLAGASTPEGKKAPNLTPVRLKKLGDAELQELLASGITPDGDVVGETMGEVIRNSTSQLTAPDLAALVAYLRTLPPIAEDR